MAHEYVEIEGISVPTGHFIGGEHVSSVETFETRSPMQWDWKLADIARGTKETANQAVTAAVDAFPVWSRYTVQDRATCLQHLADLIDENKDDIATVECLDMAMLLESLKLRLIPRAALNFRNYSNIIIEA